MYQYEIHLLIKRNGSRTVKLGVWGTYIETENQIWRVPNKAAGATSVDSARSVGSMRVQNSREWAHSGRNRGRGGVFPA